MLDLLKGVSRSFYLSIRLLPPPMREPVALGYLLARASDTIADAPGLRADDRLEALDAFAAAVEGSGEVPALRAIAGATPHEARLIDAVPQCLAWLARLEPADREDVRDVLRHITRGQRLDIVRPSLSSEAELDEYTWLVAGCVGEFWTNLGVRHVRDFTWLPPQEMLDLGRRYGMALQLINVLRDSDRDIRDGRRYVPPGTSRDFWLDRARAGLDAGMRYASAVRPARIRVATALPALIGARTLSLLGTGAAGAKMRRRDLRAMLLRTLLGAGNHAGLQLEFRRQWDNRAR